MLSHERIWAAIDTLAKAVLSARREPKLGPSLAAQALWTIAETVPNKTPPGVNIGGSRRPLI